MIYVRRRVCKKPFCSAHYLQLMSATTVYLIINFRRIWCAPRAQFSYRLFCSDLSYPSMQIFSISWSPSSPPALVHLFSQTSPRNKNPHSYSVTQLWVWQTGVGLYASRINKWPTNGIHLHTWQLQKHFLRLPFEYHASALGFLRFGNVHNLTRTYTSDMWTFARSVSTIWFRGMWFV